MTFPCGTSLQSRNIGGAKCLYFTYFKKYWGCYSIPCSTAPPAPQAPTALSTNLPSYNMRRPQGNLRFRILDHLYMDYLGHANLATFTFTLQYEDAPAQKFVDFDRRSLVKVHTVFQSNFSHIVCRSTWTSSKLQNSLEPLFLRVRGPLFANVCEFMF